MMRTYIGTDMLVLMINILVGMVVLFVVCSSFIGVLARQTRQCVFRIDIPDAVQAVAYSQGMLYLLQPHKLAMFDTTGKKLKEVYTGTGHLHGVTVFNNNVFVTNAPGEDNNIEVFDMNINHLRTLSIPINGDLMWIDVYDGDFYGMIGFYGNEQSQTRLIRFSKQWTIDESWELPQTVLNGMWPSSCGGGRFLSNGDIYLTGEQGGYIYVVKFNGGVLEHVSTISAPITGNGIDVVSNSVSRGVIIFGIDNVKKQVVEIKECAFV